MEATGLLFSYGTLRQQDVQHATFGRSLDGSPDGLPGFALRWLKITDAAVVETSGQTHHPIVAPSPNPQDKVEGTVFEVTAAELLRSDDYEVVDYRRERVKLASGREAWVYLAA